MDNLTPEERSAVMKKVRSNDTKPEVFLRKSLFRLGYRYGLHPKKIQGKPDIWLKKYKTAIFVNGCFWHRHEGCKMNRLPKSNIEFWQDKFQKNIDRDKKVKSALLKRQVKCLVVWECTVKKMMKDEEYKKECLIKIENFIHDSNLYLEL
ncbi:very short patch repair endonuclease [uncultured Dubosiella sp.]|uniref:very short patch repair endonuclease n=1 Tax=uncultured Dubosiella sp. TaxID=1937011 RepID=UPI0025B47697|nr:DNA mismatch endonuclease Vsr [uncultured Dubosiella sp.]